MPKAIELFMWGYQPHFRSTLELRAKRVFELIGADFRPATFLVGVARPEAGGVHSICIEPEDGAWTLATFEGLPTRIEEAIKVHPEQQMFYGDEPSMRDKPEKIRQMAIAEEVRRTLDQADGERGIRTFCSTAYPVEHHYVVCVLQFPDAIFRKFPAVPYRWQGEQRETSLIHSCIYQLLEEARRALSMPEPGRSILGNELRLPEEIVRTAAGNFLRTPFIEGHFGYTDMFEEFDRLSQLMYERKKGTGRLILAAADDPNVEFVLKLAKPVRLRETRWARKLLQMATTEAALITDYEAISGLGKVSDVSAAPYCVDFLDRQEWDFKRGDQTLLRTSFGQARLPQEPIGAERFIDNMKRLFPKITDEAVSRYRKVLDILVQQPRGSMLVVASDAAEEARRLELQGTPVQPTPLTRELLERASQIDGTIIADPRGICHAVGVILDGQANENCTPSRGARYNSAVRYVSGAPSERMAFVVSDDRTLDIVPLLRVRASRAALAKAIDELKTSTLDDYFEARNFLEDHRFYLDVTQSAAVNEALDRIESEPVEVGRIVFKTRRFQPNPAMNESYLRD